MKTFITFAFLAVITIACQQKSPAVDPAAATAGAIATADAYHKALKAKSTDGIMQLFTEDVLVCGTDPSEVWDAKIFKAYLVQAFADTTMVIADYPIDKRDVKVGSDGTSVILQDQAKVGVLSKRLSARFVFNIVKRGDAWLINYASLSMIPTNDDLSKIDAALAQMK